MRHLPKHERYKCRECKRTKYGNYFLSETLCKKCGAKRRSPNVPVNLSDSIVVTANVERRIRKSADSAVPITIKYFLSAAAFYLTLIAVWGTGLGYAVSSAPMTESNGMRWVIGLGVFFGGVIIGNLVEEKSKGPKLERAKQVDGFDGKVALQTGRQLSQLVKNGLTRARIDRAD